MRTLMTAFTLKESKGREPRSVKIPRAGLFTSCSTNQVHKVPPHRKLMTLCICVSDPVCRRCPAVPFFRRILTGKKKTSYLSRSARGCQLSHAFLLLRDRQQTRNSPYVCACVMYIYVARSFSVKEAYIYSELAALRYDGNPIWRRGRSPPRRNIMG